MKERPIIFNSDMVRAILDGRKTQTRRIIKPQPDVTEQELKEVGAWVEGMTLSDHVNSAWQNGFIDVQCPFGVIGDRLWVRETFALALPTAFGDIVPKVIDPENKNSSAIFRASFNLRWAFGWKPSIHMPRWASRINLEITNVRVERLKDISEEDAKAEGCVNSLHLQGGRFANENFAWLWQSIYGEESWFANPWVWVIEFDRA